MASPFMSNGPVSPGRLQWVINIFFSSGRANGEDPTPVLASTSEVAIRNVLYFLNQLGCEEGLSLA